jgi:hypothetical protein
LLDNAGVGTNPGTDEEQSAAPLQKLATERPSIAHPNVVTG